MIAIPVSSIAIYKLLVQLLRVSQLQLCESKEQTQVLHHIAADVHALWGQTDETPVGFKINATKL